MKRQKGFTIIELYSAMAIIAVLSILAYPAWNFFVEMPRRTEAINVTTLLVNKQKLYFMDSGTSRYAPDIPTLRPNLPPGWACVGSVCENEHWRVTMETTTTSLKFIGAGVSVAGLVFEDEEAGIVAVATPLSDISIPKPPFFFIRGERINSHRAIPGFWADGLGKSGGMTLTQQ